MLVERVEQSVEEDFTTNKKKGRKRGGTVSGSTCNLYTCFPEFPFPCPLLQGFIVILERTAKHSNGRREEISLWSLGGLRDYLGLVTWRRTICWWCVSSRAWKRMSCGQGQGSPRCLLHPHLLYLFFRVPFSCPLLRGLNDGQKRRA